MTTTTRPNLRHIARALDLSVTTVSRALKNGPEVNPKTVARVQEAARKMGYVPNRTGRALRTGRTQVLSAILPLETRAYLSDIARLPLIEGMTIAAQRGGYTLSVHSALPDEDPLDVVRKVVGLGASDGLVITRMEAQDPRIDWLTEMNVPFVTFGRSGSAVAHASVDVDNAHIARSATEQLLAEGHRRIALQVLGESDMSSLDRIAGYRAALERHGIALDPALIGTQHFDMETSRAAFDQLMELPEPPTAMVCVTELGLLGALSALRRRGLSPEQDFALITRDNTRMCQYLGLPGIRALPVDMEQVGRLLIDSLLHRIDHPEAPAQQHLLSPDAIWTQPAPQP